jgi:hypothetical protein
MRESSCDLSGFWAQRTPAVKEAAHKISAVTSRLNTNASKVLFQSIHCVPAWTRDVGFSATAAPARAYFWGISFRDPRVSTFEDLSDYTYCLAGATSKARPAKNIGWLGPSSEFEVSPPNPHLTRVLWDHCLVSINPARGIHACHLCKPMSRSDAERDGTWIVLGAAEIRVFSRTGTVYAAPNLIYHYVSVHGYAPPEEFVHAAFNGIAPASDEYVKSLSALGVKWWPTPISKERAKRIRFVRTPNGVERIEE